MSALHSTLVHGLSDRVPQDHIVLFGGSPRTSDLLRLAVIRSDDVLLIIDSPGDPVRRLAQTYAVEMRGRRAPDIASATAVLVAIGDVEAENAIVREARAAGTSVHVANRPLVSDFTLLEFVERQPSTLKVHAQT